MSASEIGTLVHKINHKRAQGEGTFPEYCEKCREIVLTPLALQRDGAAPEHGTQSQPNISPRYIQIWNVNQIYWNN